MKIGDLIEHNMGYIGIVTDIEYMYPGYPDSPASRVKVRWNDPPVDWADPQLWHTGFSISRVLSKGR